MHVVSGVRKFEATNVTSFQWIIKGMINDNVTTRKNETLRKPFRGFSIGSHACLQYIAKKSINWHRYEFYNEAYSRAPRFSTFFFFSCVS